MNLGLDTQFPDFSSDQLGVLGAQIEHQDLVHVPILAVAITKEKGEICFRFPLRVILFIMERYPKAKMMKVCLRRRT